MGKTDNECKRGVAIINILGEEEEETHRNSTENLDIEPLFIPELYPYPTLEIIPMENNKNPITLPKKEKTDRKYITLAAGTDFRSIAQIMTDNGFRMNHATARNQVIQTLEKLIIYVSGRVRATKSNKTSNDQQIKSAEVEELLKNQTLHNALGDVLYRAYKSDLDQEE